MFVSAVRAQNPGADFTVSKQAGCSPLTVSFRDSSSGDPKYWNWDFGNGQISNVQHPTVTYTRPGTYTVTLVVRNAFGTDGITKESLITVAGSPTANFAADRINACIPSTINFSDRSIDTTGTLTAWEWSFGDGTTSSEQNPSHSYSQPGFYTVSLKVTSSSGCTSTSTRVRLIRIFSGVIADFVPTAPATCRPPFDVTLMNQTSGPGVMSYTWDLGNGATSTAQNPAVTYSSNGTYSARLTATSDFGCSNTVEKSFPIQQFNTDFSGPDTICINSFASFTNISTDSAQLTEWRLGDSSYAGSGATRFFAAAGIYPIRLIQSFGTCKDSVTRNLVVVNKPQVQFTSDKTEGCRAPFIVNFTDQTPNAVAWLWEFGDGTSSTDRTPQHEYTSLGTFDVKLTVTDRFGCTDTLLRAAYIQIAAPTVQIRNAPAGGCAPFIYSPTINLVSVEPVTNYLWDFGDGGTSSAAAPTHTYADSGTYNLSLRITTASGCEAFVSVANGVRVGKLPVANFTVVQTDVCASTAVQFLDNSTGGVNAWNWNFGDGSISNLQNPTHQFRDTGMMQVTLTALNNGCPATLTRSNSVHIQPPVADFTVDVSCVQSGLVNFTNRSLLNPNLPVKYFWQFGDPDNNIDSVRNPQFRFPGVGTYNVSLTVTQDTCSNVFVFPVTVTSERAQFSVSKSSVCLNENVTLSATGSNSSNISSYRWRIDQGNWFPGGRSIDTSFQTTGDRTISLITVDINGCTDTLVRVAALSVTGPTAGFSVNQFENCVDAPVTFNDTTKSPVAIRTWRWDFGDGNSAVFTAPGFTHTYTDTGLFKVTLTVEDVNGCVDSNSVINVIHVSKARANFGSDTTVVCPGIPITLSDSSAGPELRYQWYFGDGRTSTAQQPIHSYSGDDAIYTVSLRVTNEFGCSDSLARENFISVRTPKASFNMRDSLTLCPPFETAFYNTGTDFETIYWDMGDGSNALLGDTVRHFFNAYGTYNPKLILVGYGGCRDTATKTVRVVNPNSVVMDYSPLGACNRLNVDFNLQPPAGTRFLLQFGDGKTDSTQRTTLSHLYPAPAIYNPVMVITDPTGCIVNVGGRNPIRVIGAIPLFGVDNTQFCDSGTVFFTNYSLGNDPVITHTWNFGDGQTSNNRDEVHSYSQPGIYTPTLTVLTRSGCTDSVQDTIVVHSTPATTIISKDTVCVGELVLLNGQLNSPATSPVEFSWSFGDGSTSSINNPSHRFGAPGNYTITLNTTVPFGCSSVSTKEIVVVPGPEIIFGEDPTIVSGRSTPVPVTYNGDIIRYEWTPPRDLTCTDCPFPNARPRYDTRYSLTVTDRRGCTSTAEIQVNVVCSGSNVFLPTTFSPNGDGSNDIFYVRGTGLFSVKSFRVFNRWGQMVFEKLNFQPNQQTHGWNGKLNGKDLSSDVYVYAVEVMCDNGEVFIEKGNVMLLR